MATDSNISPADLVSGQNMTRNANRHNAENNPGKFNGVGRAREAQGRGLSGFSRAFQEATGQTHRYPIDVPAPQASVMQLFRTGHDTTMGKIRTPFGNMPLHANEFDDEAVTGQGEGLTNYQVVVPTIVDKVSYNMFTSTDMYEKAKLLLPVGSLAFQMHFGHENSTSRAVLRNQSTVPERNLMYSLPMLNMLLSSATLRSLVLKQPAPLQNVMFSDEYMEQLRHMIAFQGGILQTDIASAHHAGGTNGRGKAVVVNSVIKGFTLVHNIWGMYQNRMVPGAHLWVVLTKVRKGYEEEFFKETIRFGNDGSGTRSETFKKNDGESHVQLMPYVSIEAEPNTKRLFSDSRVDRLFYIGRLLRKPKYLQRMSGSSNEHHRMAHQTQLSRLSGKFQSLSSVGNSISMISNMTSTQLITDKFIDIHRTAQLLELVEIAIDV
jgi:hypothetical protein